MNIWTRKSLLIWKVIPILSGFALVKICTLRSCLVISSFSFRSLSGRSTYAYRVVIESYIVKLEQQKQANLISFSYIELHHKLGGNLR